MPTLTLNRDYTLTTDKGHVIKFEKDKPTHVPQIVYADAIAIGALPSDGSDANVIEEAQVSKAPVDPAERQPLILMAIEDIVARNEREDFTAAGSPTVEAVSKVVEFKVRATEIAQAWQAYHDKKAAQ